MSFNVFLTPEKFEQFLFKWFQNTVTLTVTNMIFVGAVIELLIIASAWVASSMTPDPEDGKYILIHAARHFMPLPLGCLFMVTVVGIIISTADSDRKRLLNLLKIFTIKNFRLPIRKN